MLRDIEGLCALVFSHRANAATGSPSEGLLCAQSEFFSLSLSKKHATQALGRLIDLLQASACCNQFLHTHIHTHNIEACTSVSFITDSLVICRLQSLWTFTNPCVLSDLAGAH